MLRVLNIDGALTSYQSFFVNGSTLQMQKKNNVTIYTQEKCSDHIVAQQANRYIVAFHIAISRYRTIRSGLDITGGL